MGSLGTVVFKGRLHGRPVAVKRLLPEFTVLADNECAALQAVDWHPNIVRYLLTERTQHFVYIALEECATSAWAYFQWRYHGEAPAAPANLAAAAASSPIPSPSEAPLPAWTAWTIDPLVAFHDVASGLAHLHRMGAVHRDLKPHNILLQPPRRPGDAPTVKISDFGLCR
ncbi:kinase-like protein, partial [Caulochytrium protostelioides]